MDSVVVALFMKELVDTLEATLTPLHSGIEFEKY